MKSTGSFVDFLHSLTFAAVVLAVIFYNSNSEASTDLVDRIVEVAAVHPTEGTSAVEIVPPEGADVAWCYVQPVDVNKLDNGNYQSGFQLWCKFYTEGAVWWEQVAVLYPKENTI